MTDFVLQKAEASGLASRRRRRYHGELLAGEALRIFNARAGIESSVGVKSASNARQASAK